MASFRACGTLWTAAPVLRRRGTAVGRASLCSALLVQNLSLVKGSLVETSDIRTRSQSNSSVKSQFTSHISQVTAQSSNSSLKSQFSQVIAQSSHGSVKSQLSQVTAQSSHSSVKSQLSQVTAQSSHSSVK